MEELDVAIAREVDGRMRAIPAASEQDVPSAWRQAEPVVLTQAWSQRDEVVGSGSVRLAATRDTLWVQATLRDEDMFSEATEDSQRLWELGDVFEMFFEAERGATYTEMHVNPLNHKMHLRFEQGAFLEVAAGKRSFESCMIRPPRFESRVNRSEDGWIVEASVLFSEIENAPQGPQRSWRASFCRYDCWRDGRPPQLSSTSAHEKPNFHRRQDWREICF